MRCVRKNASDKARTDYEITPMPDESSNFRSDATRPHHPLSQQADCVFFRGQAACGVQVRKTRVMGNDASGTLFRGNFLSTIRFRRTAALFLVIAAALLLLPLRPLLLSWRRR